MKTITKIFVFILLMSFSNLVFANDWVYAGRYVLRSNFSHTHHTDVFLMNHLTSYSNQLVGTGKNDYSLYDVYYMHDHASDTGDGTKEYDDRSFQFQAKIVPLNIYGKVMDYTGTYSGTVVSEFIIAAKGVLGVSPKHQKVYDRKTNQLLFEASGDMGSEPLYKDSAAEAILKHSGDHPVSHGTSDELNGSSYYPYN